jgi:hypothetical protein
LKDDGVGGLVQKNRWYEKNMKNYRKLLDKNG